MKRFGPTSYNFTNELYDLTRDPGERKNLAEDPAFHETVELLSTRVSEFFDTHSVARWNLWEGGVIFSQLPSSVSSSLFRPSNEKLVGIET